MQRSRFRMATLAAMQWSVALLESVCSSLQLAPSSFAQWEHVYCGVFFAMLSCLCYVPPYCRPLPALKWLQSRGFTLGSSEGRALVSAHAFHYSHFVELFDAFDRDYIESPDASPSNEDLSATSRMFITLSLMRNSFLDQDRILACLLQHNAVPLMEQGILLYAIARQGLSSFPLVDLWKEISNPSEEHRLGAFALAFLVGFANKPFTYEAASALVQLMDHVETSPTHLLCQYGRRWSSRYACFIVAHACTTQPFDKLAYLHQILDWLSDNSATPLDVLHHLRMVSALVEHLYLSCGQSILPTITSGSPAYLPVITACRLITTFRAHEPSTMLLQLPSFLLSLIQAEVLAVKQRASSVGASSIFIEWLPSAFLPVFLRSIPPELLGRVQGHKKHLFPHRRDTHAATVPDHTWAALKQTYFPNASMHSKSLSTWTCAMSPPWQSSTGTRRFTCGAPCSSRPRPLARMRFRPCGNPLRASLGRSLGLCARCLSRAFDSRVGGCTGRTQSRRAHWPRIWLWAGCCPRSWLSQQRCRRSSGVRHS
ncbi:hypothetical protein BCR44DRAFT_311960 [Catenaria anguillulae PL171]|uniref:Uncharacterized protein n=1 Tax=Catenaria anguillulae PL171 TaxID=765915 RepID=A0A1Y2H4V7_9FUNG|nr:hypothetical protein BCR44DRAFT_311960 [Catenaria anguillulae PL171]